MLASWNKVCSTDGQGITHPFNHIFKGPPHQIGYVKVKVGPPHPSPKEIVLDVLSTLQKILCLPYAGFDLILSP